MDHDRSVDNETRKKQEHVFSNTAYAGCIGCADAPLQLSRLGDGGPVLLCKHFGGYIETPVAQGCSYAQRVTAPEDGQLSTMGDAPQESYLAA